MFKFTRKILLQAALYRKSSSGRIYLKKSFIKKKSNTKALVNTKRQNINFLKSLPDIYFQKGLFYKSKIQKLTLNNTQLHLFFFHLKQNLRK